MQSIIGFFEGIATAIVSVIDFVVSFFEDVVYLIKLTARFLGQLPSYFVWLPSPIVALLLTIFAVVVIYKVLGREG